MSELSQDLNYKRKKNVRATVTRYAYSLLQGKRVASIMTLSKNWLAFSNNAKETCGTVVERYGIKKLSKSWLIKVF